MSKDITHLTGTIEQIKEIGHTIKQLEERRTMLKETVIEALAGETEGLIDDRIAVKHSVTMSNRFDVTAFKAADPDTYQRFTKTSQSVRFLLIDEDTEQ